MTENLFQLYSQAWMTLLMYGIELMLTIITFVCLWYIMKKMRQPGWKGIVPYYNIWTLIRTMKKPIWWFWAQVAGVALILVFTFSIAGMAVAAAYGGVVPAEGWFIAYGAVMMVVVITMIVLQILVSHALSKSFGRGGWFTVGLIFLPFIFFPILAFGDDVFTEPEICILKKDDLSLPPQSGGISDEEA